MLLVVCQLSRDVIGYEDSYIRVFIANNMATYLTNQINNQSIIPSTDVIQLTLTLKMTTAQVVETSVTVNKNSPIQDYVHPDDQTQPTFVLFNLLASRHSKREVQFFQSFAFMFLSVYSSPTENLPL